MAGSLRRRLHPWPSGSSFRLFSAVRSARHVGGSAARRLGGSFRFYKEICVSMRPRLGIFRPVSSPLSRSRLSGCRGAASILSKVCRRAGHPLRGVWCGLFALVFWSCSVVCVRLCVASAGVARSAVCPLSVVWWPRSVVGAVSLVRSVFGLCSARGRKTPKICKVVAVLSALGVPFPGRSADAAQAGRSHRTAPARGGARKRPFNSTIENTITRFYYT